MPLPVAADPGSLLPRRQHILIQMILPEPDPAPRAWAGASVENTQTNLSFGAFLVLENRYSGHPRGRSVPVTRTSVHLENTSLPSLSVPGAMPSADALLVEQIRRGDAEAGRRFVREYYPSVYRYLLYLAGQPELADDLTQETFVQAWRNLDALDDRVVLRPWLHRIAHREFLQVLRSRRPLASLEDVAEIPAPQAAAQAHAVELREVIRRLPLGEREVVVLHYLEGYSYDEIAQILGAPVGRVRQRLVEARARLRRELSDEASSSQR
jgi:RNA polymerase sigma-70 factor (ECF subfamily)